MKFTIVPLGIRVGKVEGVGFSGEGSWAALKCFYEGEEGYGEFYLNINPKTGEGEFDWKDPGYAPALVKAFGKTMEGKGLLPVEKAISS